MTPFQQFQKFYGDDWIATLFLYCQEHYVYSSKTAIGLVKPEGDSWWIEYAGGDLKELMQHLPYWLPQIAYSTKQKHLLRSNDNDKGKVRCYATAKLVNRFLKDASHV